MSTIYLDTTAMDATAGAIGEHAREVESTVADLELSGRGGVPAALAGWFAEEMREITLIARLAGLIYVAAALDTALRAQRLQADQSLSAAITAPVAVHAGAPVASAAEVSSFFETAIHMQSSEDFLAHNPLVAAASNLQGTNPGAANELLGLHNFLGISNADITGTWVNSRPGASYIGGGLYEGDDGDTGSILDVYRNPKHPGEFLVD